MVRTLIGLSREVVVDRLLPVDGEVLRHQEVVDWVEHVPLDVFESLSTMFIPLLSQPSSSINVPHVDIE